MREIVCPISLTAKMRPRRPLWKPNCEFVIRQVIAFKVEPSSELN